MRGYKILSAVLGTTIIIFIFLILKSEHTNNRLITQLQLQDSLSKSKLEKDSVFEEKTKEFAKVITKYVSDCNFSIGGKKVTTAEVVRRSNLAFAKVDLLNDSLTMVKDELKVSEKSFNEYRKNVKEFEKLYNQKLDSLNASKKLLMMIERNYKIGTSYRLEGQSIYYSLTGEGIDRIDSALVLLPYYRHYLKLDSGKKTWTIITDNNRQIQRHLKRNKKN